MFIGDVWAQPQFIHLWSGSIGRKSLLIKVKVYGEALKLLAPNHKSDSREENDEKHLINHTNSVIVSLIVTSPAGEKGETHLLALGFIEGCQHSPDHLCGTGFCPFHFRVQFY